MNLSIPTIAKNQRLMAHRSPKIAEVQLTLSLSFFFFLRGEWSGRSYVCP